MKTPIQKAAAAMGRKGGLAKSEVKKSAAKANAATAGRHRQIFTADDITAESVLLIHRAATDAAWGIGSVVEEIAGGQVSPADAATKINRLLAKIERATNQPKP